VHVLVCSADQFLTINVSILRNLMPRRFLSHSTALHKYDAFLHRQLMTVTFIALEPLLQ
jgi:hypothetical protein